MDSTWVTQQGDTDGFPFRVGFTISISNSTQVRSSNFLLFALRTLISVV